MSMFSIGKKTWLPAVVLALAGSVPSFAAEPEPPAPVKPEPAKVAASESLNDESLLQMMRGLGYEPYQTGTFSDGIKFYWVKMDREGYVFNVRFSLSPDKSVVWLQTYLGDVPAADKIAPQTLQKLIEAQNSAVGRFWISENKLYYQLPIDNRSVTPQHLRNRIDTFARVLKSTADLWKTSAWTKDGAEAGDFHQKLLAAQKKLAAAMTEFGTALRPLGEGKEIDAANLDRAYEGARKAIRDFGEELRAMKVPNSPAARELVDAYKQLINLYEKVLDAEMAEIVQIAKDTSLTPAQRSAKFPGLLAKSAEKEKALQEAIQAAMAKFLKYHQLS